MDFTYLREDLAMILTLLRARLKVQQMITSLVSAVYDAKFGDTVSRFWKNILFNYILIQEVFPFFFPSPFG